MASLKGTAQEIGIDELFALQGYLLLIGGLLLASCSNSGRAEMTPTLLQTLNVSLASPAESATPIPSAVRIAIATRTPAATSTVTPTRAPTLAPGQAQAVVLELLRTNGNCELPCWWGLVPGQTTWDEALALLEPIASRIAEYGQPNVTPNRAEVFFLTLPKEVSSPYIQLDFAMQSGVVERILVSGFEWPDYQLPQLLSGYGQPNEVWIHTEGFTPEAYRLFGLVLLYTQRGVLVSYSTEGELAGSTIQGCFQGNPSLWLWHGDRSMTFTEAAELFSWDVQNVLYLPLSDATGMTVDMFYQSFKDEQVVCLQTPKNLWP